MNAFFSTLIGRQNIENIERETRNITNLLFLLFINIFIFYSLLYYKKFEDKRFYEYNNNDNGHINN